MTPSSAGLHIYRAFRCQFKVLGDSLTVDVLELSLILLIQTYLSFEEHVAKIDDFWYIGHLERILQYLKPDAIDFTNLSDF